MGTGLCPLRVRTRALTYAPSFKALMILTMASGAVQHELE